MTPLMTATVALILFAVRVVVCNDLSTAPRIHTWAADHATWRKTADLKGREQILSNYQAPKVIELGTVGAITRGSGDQFEFDSLNPGNSGRTGFVQGDGGVFSGSNG